jgi:hypothetical protein
VNAPPPAWIHLIPLGADQFPIFLSGLRRKDFRYYTFVLLGLCKFYADPEVQPHCKRDELGRAEF